MISAVIIYSLSSIPTGYIEINSTICKHIYNINLDGKILKSNGKKILIKGHCYKKDITNG